MMYDLIAHVYLPILIRQIFSFYHSHQSDGMNSGQSWIHDATYIIVIYIQKLCSFHSIYILFFKSNHKINANFATALN